MIAEFYPIDTPGGDIDRIVSEYTDGSFVAVAIEIFDHRTSAWSDHHGATIGPWIVGALPDCEAWLSEQGYEEFEVQYSAGYDDEENE